MPIGTLAFTEPHPIVAFMQSHCRGRCHAMTYRQIARELGRDARKLRKEIETLRQEKHVPILSDCEKGYWYSDDAAECRAFRHAMIRRGINCIRTGRGLLPAEIDLCGQGHLSMGGTQ